MDLNHSSSWNSILESLKPHIPTINFDSSSEGEENDIFERPEGLSLELPEDILEDIKYTLMEDGEQKEQPTPATQTWMSDGNCIQNSSACENNIKGAKLNIKAHMDNRKSDDHFSGLSFAKLDELDLDKVLQNLQEEGLCLQKCVTAEPPKIHTDGDAERFQDNIMKRLVALCTSQSSGAESVPGKEPQNPLLGLKDKSSKPSFSTHRHELHQQSDSQTITIQSSSVQSESGKCDQTRVKEPKQQSDQQRKKAGQKLKHQQTRKELERHRPTKSACGNQPAAAETDVLYDGKASYLQPIRALPADIEKEECVLLSVKLSCPGMAADRSNRKGKEKNLNSAVSNVDIYNTLVAWCLSLVGSGPLCDEEEAGVEVPFRVAGLQQVWMEDGLALHVLVRPAHCHKSKKGHVDVHLPSFYNHICSFLSQTLLTEIADWLPELKIVLEQQAYASPTHLLSFCLNSFISATSDKKVIDRKFGLSPGFYWQTVETQECVCQSRETMVTQQQLHTEVAVAVGSTAFCLHPLITHYTLQLVGELGLDVCGLRLLYPPQRFLSDTSGGKPLIQSENESCQPVIALAVRGPYAYSLLQKLTGSLNAQLARKTDPAHLNALHCRCQDLPIFHSCRLASGTYRQLCVWFSGRFQRGRAQNHKLTPNRVIPSEDKSHMIHSSASSAFLCATTEADTLLIVSPAVSPRCYGLVLAVCERRGFSVRGLQRLQVHSHGAKVLRLTRQQALVFCSPPTVKLDQEEAEPNSHCLVLLLRRENTLRHSISLPAALMREFEAHGLLGYVRSRLDDVQSIKSICFFHTVPYSGDMFHIFVRGMWAVPDPSGVTLARQKCESNPEEQQVVILTMCGKDTRQGLRVVHRALTAGPDGNVRHTGFELLALKWLPALTRPQAKELSPYEVGEPLWCGSLDSLTSHPVLVFALRRQDAFASLQNLLPNDHTCNMNVLMSATPEVAFRQASVLFFKHDMIPDPSRCPLLNLLPHTCNTSGV
ncbi:hypothetical protein LDENG_00004240 [Lucifuga dentata]|nr:hypothetical protein LDENG_00004240 [Lucifuga dentata]